jgi:hypothetical protein
MPAADEGSLSEDGLWSFDSERAAENIRDDKQGKFDGDHGGDVPRDRMLRHHSASRAASADALISIIGPPDERGFSVERDSSEV